MPYGLKYQTQFTSVQDDNNPSRDYTLKFLFKDYAGEVATLTGGGTTVIQRCTVDEPNAAIKGQSLDIRLINEGNIPISSFHEAEISFCSKMIGEFFSHSDTIIIVFV